MSQLFKNFPDMKHEFKYEKQDPYNSLRISYTVRGVSDDNEHPKSFFVAKSPDLLNDIGQLNRSGRGNTGFLSEVNQFTARLGVVSSYSMVLTSSRDNG
jgi:hypothetical protein